MNRPKSYLLKVGSLIIMATGVAIYGNSCGQYNSSSSFSNGSAVDQLCSEGTEFEIIEGTKTASIAYGPQVLDNMVACTGLSQLSQKTLDAYQARQASLSEYGNVLDVNPPLVMAHTALAVEVCDDLYKQEMAQSMGARRIFASLNDSASAPSPQEISETLRRMSRACWGREETDEELNIVSEEVNQIISNASSASEAHRFTAISVCTSVLASLDGYKM